MFKRKIDKIESELMQSLHYEEAALVTALGKVDRQKNELWVSLKKKYKVPEDAIATINHKTKKIEWSERK